MASVPDPDLEPVVRRVLRRGAAPWVALGLAAVAVAVPDHPTLRPAGAALTLVAVAGVLAARRDHRRLESTLDATVERLRRNSTHDLLTGLPNRATLLEQLAPVLEDPGTSRAGGVAVAAVSIDRFQHVNHTLGHERGDTLVRVLAERMSELVEPPALLARLSGDEFLVVVPAPDAAAVDALAEHLQAALRRPVELGGSEIVTTASIGTTWHEFDPLRADPVTPDLLVQQADLALRAAEEAGRARHHRYEPSLQAASRRRLTLAGELRRALRHDEFEVFYQPIVSMSAGRIVGAEALLRWNHPERGVLSAHEFVDVAAETGLLAQVGRRVLTESCRRFSVLNRSLTDQPVHVAVNLSGPELVSAGITADLDEILRASGLHPGLLTLEVSEGIVADPVSVAILEDLHALGVRLSIDDFGTGASSLRQLRQFPAVEVKVDRSYVSGIVTDPADRAVVAAVCRLAAALGLEVVAEGVETDEQATTLLELGCQRAQGWRFGRPQPFSRFVAALRTPIPIGVPTPTDTAPTDTAPADTTPADTGGTEPSAGPARRPVGSGTASPIS